MHGHRFDEFIDAHPVISFLADCVYGLLQRLDSSHQFAKMAKHGSKTFLRCARKVEEKAVEYARRLHCAAVCCGHTHVAAAREGGDVAYYNSGCWTERPCTYLTVTEGEIRLHFFEAEEVEAEAPADDLIPAARLFAGPS